jgi:hypothetical protein
VEQSLEAVRELWRTSPYSFEPHDPDVIVIGHRRIRTPEGVRGDYLFFVHSFRDGRVSRIAAHMSKEAALADIAARYRGRPWPS